MTNVLDLHIEEQIAPLFDFTHNDFSKNTLVSILKEPLNSIDEILFRQDLLKGFIVNHEILKEYSYSRFELLEVHDFIGKISERKAIKRGFKLSVLLWKTQRSKTRGKFIQ